MKQKAAACVLSAALALTLASPAFAAQQEYEKVVCPGPDPVEQSTSVAEGAEESVLYYGQVTGIGEDENGVPVRLYLQSEAYGDYIMILNEDTVWVDSGNKTASDPATLEVGEGVYVFHSPVSTRSMPPQSVAYAVVRNIPQDVGVGQYYKVGEITEEEDGTFRILTSDGSMYITAGEDTGLSSYVEGESFQLSDLKAGDRIMAWYEIVLTSYPGQTYAYHLMLLPDETEAESEDGAPAEGTQISLELNGEASELVGRYEGGTVMVPVAAVAQTLGFDVTYIPGKDGAADQVLVESEAFQVQLTIGSNLIVGVTRIPDAVGMTAPQDYGKAPYIVEPGTTWAPAQLFEMLGKTVSLDGTHLTIA